MNRRKVVGAKRLKKDKPKKNGVREPSSRASAVSRGVMDGAATCAPMIQPSRTGRAKALARWENEGGRVVPGDHQLLGGA